MKLLAVLIFVLAIAGLNATEPTVTEASSTEASTLAETTTTLLNSNETVGLNVTDFNTEIKGKTAGTNAASKLMSLSSLAVLPLAFAFYF